jgi:hypothetical protein
VPLSDICTAAKNTLFDHVVGELLKLQRHVETEGFGGLEVDHEFTVTTVPLEEWRRASTSTVEDVRRLACRPRAFQIL